MKIHPNIKDLLDYFSRAFPKKRTYNPDAYQSRSDDPLINAQRNARIGIKLYAFPKPPTVEQQVARIMSLTKGPMGLEPLAYSFNSPFPLSVADGGQIENPCGEKMFRIVAGEVRLVKEKEDSGRITQK